MDVVDIAIAGGGPGGLATAAALIAAFDGKLRVKVQFGRNTHTYATPSCVLLAPLCHSETLIIPTCIDFTHV